jgi:3',5'-cyclic AMP phosphodiesterase CpdA
MTLRLAHLADLHFGEDLPGLGARLAADIRAQAPDAVLVSGDLTSRARPAELTAAFAFLAALGPPVLAVPGNHDIPATDPVARLLHPRRRWRAAAPQATHLSLPGLTVLGLDTTTRAHWHLDWSAGAIPPRRLAALAHRLRDAPPPVIVLCHHPLRHPAALPGRRTPRGATAACALLRKAGVRAVLSGHLHHAAALPLGTPWPVNLLAPSALSPRGHGTPNGWLLLELPEAGLRATLRQFAAGAWQARPLFSAP